MNEIMFQEKLIKLGNEIKKIRLSKNISQDDLAKLTGLDRSYISEIETGKKSPTITTLLKLCEALDIELHEMVKSI